MIMLISALFATAISAMKANSRVEIPSGPSSTTSRSGASEPDSWSVGTTYEAVSVTSRYSTPAIASPVKSARGNVREGRFVSSATLTESSKPIIA